MTYISRDLETLAAIAKKAGVGLIRDFTELGQLQSAPKGHVEFTQAAVERTMNILRNELNKFRPSVPVITKFEELGEEDCFAVLPLDGRDNFMHSIPYFAISITIFHKKEPISGVIYNPATGDVFFAEKGSGAFKEGYRNHLRARVSARKDMSLCLIAAENLHNTPCQLRNFGAVSLDLAAVAFGQLDGAIKSDKILADISCGVLMVREAGGRVLTPQQKDIRTDDLNQVFATGNLIAGNPDIVQQLYKLD